MRNLQQQNCLTLTDTSAGPQRSACSFLAGRGSPATGRYRSAGFTIIELMIVISIILILIGMAAVRYENSMRAAREATLAADLRIMRDAIERYTMDKAAAPGSLDDLVNSSNNDSGSYLREIPTDPITHQKDWITDPATFVLSPDQTSASGIGDVHSGAPGNGLNGKPYSQW